MDTADGWAAPRTVDRAADAHVLVGTFHRAHAAFLTFLSTAHPDEEMTPGAVAHHRAECCDAASALLRHLPPLAEDTDGAEPRCVSGIDALTPRPPEVLIAALAAAAAEGRSAHDTAVATVACVAADTSESRRIAATVEAALEANERCRHFAEAVQAALSAARAAIPDVPAADVASLSPEECGRLRAEAERFLTTEGPWAGETGLQRRAAAVTEFQALVDNRAKASKTAKRSKRAVDAARIALASAESDSDDDEGAVDEAKAALLKAAASHEGAAPALFAATSALQEWSTVGEGASVLKAFPGDAELTSLISGLLSAEFKAETALPQTPGVDMTTEYPGGLTRIVAGVVHFADRAVGGGPARPVVLRQLPLHPPEAMEVARRQLQDAGRVATGLQACTGEECPGVVVATRWFVAKLPGGTADAWLEFPRAMGGSLAEALARGPGVFSAAAVTGLCSRLVRAVAQLHAAGIRHGDLNPSNIVLWDHPTPDATVVRPGIIDLLDTINVGATRTLRGSTLEWLPPEAVAKLTRGEKATGTREVDCWQLGRVCEAILKAAEPSELSKSVRAAIAPLFAEAPAARCSAAKALVNIETALSDANVAAAKSAASLQWALPPTSWLCRRGSAPGVDLVSLDATDPARERVVRLSAEVGRTVRAVYRIENVPLWHVFAAERARVSDESKGAAVPSRLRQEGTSRLSTGDASVLHGAPQRSHRLIAEAGLDPSYSGRVGALFGAATCLTPSWAKAANEYAANAGDGVFVTRVALGRVADCQKTPRKETSQYRRPPDGHHSVLGDNGSPGAVVALYRPSQMYPEHLVIFDNSKQ